MHTNIYSSITARLDVRWGESFQFTTEEDINGASPSTSEAKKYNFYTGFLYKPPNTHSEVRLVITKRKVF